MIKSVAKQTILVSGNRCGIYRLLRSLSRNRLAMLCYHTVVPGDHRDDPYPYHSAVSVRQLRDQLKIITRLF